MAERLGYVGRPPQSLLWRRVLYDGLPVRRGFRRTGSPSYELVAAQPR